MTTALDSTDLSNLRGTGAHTYRGFLAVVPQTSFATARVNQSTFSRPLAQLTVDNTSADWLDVLPGMTCWIGTSAGAYDVGVFRVRATPGATTLYLQELSTGDFGRLQNTTLRLISDNDYVTIVSDFNLWSVFPRIAYSGGLDGTFYKDYDDGYTDQNETGGAVPGVVNIGTHRQGTISGSTATLSFTASPYAFDGSASSYAWNFDDGTPSTATGAGPHSVAFPEGNRWVRCAVTFSGGAVVPAYRHVWAFGNTNQPYHLVDANSRKTKQGRRMTARIVGTAYNTNPIRQGAMVMYFEDTYYNSTATISSAASSFVGWVTSVSFQGQANGLNTYEVEMVSALELAREMVLHAQQLTVAATPAHWQQVSAALAHVDFFVFYLLHYHTTLTKLFDFQRSTLTGYVSSAWKSDRGGVTDEVGRVLARLNLSMTQDSDGTIRLVRDPAMLETSTLRSALVTRLTLSESDIKGLSFNRNFWPRIGQVQATGFSSSTDATLTQVFKSYAPGSTGGQGAGIEILDNQLLGGGALTAEAELNIRAANLYVKANRAYDNISIDLGRGNYENVIEPSQPTVVEIQVSSTYSPTGELLALLLDPTEVNIRYDANGIKQSTLTAEVITLGYAAPGQSIPIDVGNERPIDDIQFPPIDPETGLIDIPYDPFGYNPPVTGSTTAPLSSSETQIGGYLVVGGDDGTGLTRTPAQPVFTNLMTGTVDGAFDPRSPKLRADKSNGALRGWFIDDTHLYYCANLLNSSPTISTRQTFTDYTATLLRAPLGVANSVCVYGNVDGAGTWTQTFDFTDNDGGWIDRNGFGADEAIYNTGVGWQNGTTSSGEVCYIRYNLLNTATFTSASFTFTTNAASRPYQACVIAYDGTPGTDLVRNNSLAQSPGGTLSWTGSQSITTTIDLDVNVDTSAPHTITITSATFTGTGTNPFTGESSGNAKQVIYSEDTGTTIQTYILGDSQLGSGFDTDDYNLPVWIGASDDNLWFLTDTASYFVGMATVDAGSAHINLVRIPYRILSGTSSNNSAGALHFIYGMDGTDGSGRTLVRGVLDSVGNSVTLTDITPVVSGTTYRPVGPNSLETNANDSRIMLLLGVPVGGGDTRLLYRNSAGSWSVVQNPADYTYVRWVTGRAAWLAGQAGIGFTPDRGVTLEDRTGDFTVSLGALPVHYALGTGK